jgi:hypothetical protein
LISKTIPKGRRRDRRIVRGTVSGFIGCHFSKDRVITFGMNSISEILKNDYLCIK